MTLAEIRNSRAIHDAVWTYNLCAQVTECQWPEMTAILTGLVETLMAEQTALTECAFHKLLKSTTRRLELLLGCAPLDEVGVYEYGGLNALYAELAEALGYPVRRGPYALITDLVYFSDAAQ